MGNHHGCVSAATTGRMWKTYSRVATLESRRFLHQQRRQRRRGGIVARVQWPGQNLDLGVSNVVVGST